MYKHHQLAVEKTIEYFSKYEEILAVILAGSIAHGFEMENSDIDILLIISEENYRKRCALNDLTFYNPELCNYEEGYVDGKYLSMDFLKKVFAAGSEPARYAFEGASVVYSKIVDLQNLVYQIAQYPVEKKQENIKRFFAQFEAWRWYCFESFKKDNDYLLNTSISKFLLFGGRLILAYNETLYPYHKWFLKVLERVEKKPENFIELFHNVLKRRNERVVEEFYNSIIEFHEWNTGGIRWSSQFMLDSEINWLTGSVPVDDV